MSVKFFLFDYDAFLAKIVFVTPIASCEKKGQFPSKKREKNPSTVPRADFESFLFSLGDRSE